MTKTRTRSKQRQYTYALAWQGVPPPTLLPHVASTAATFLYTTKPFMAWGAAYLTAVECGGFLDLNEWPIGIAPRWLQDHACLSDLLDRLVGTRDNTRIVYVPVFDFHQDLILAVLWNPSERFVHPGGFVMNATNLSAPNPLAGNVNFPLAAHTANPMTRPPFHVGTAEGSGELLE